MEKQRLFDSDSIQELQEQLQRQAEESWYLRDGCSIKELLRDANLRVKPHKYL